MYKLNNIDISTFGAIPLSNGEAIALSGIFDLPKRKGETERSWGTEIEPFVDKADIRLEGRNLTLLVAIKGSTPEEFQSRLSTFKTACINCKMLGTDFGNFNVVQKEDIVVSRIPCENFATVSVKFWQEEVILPALTIIPTGGSGYKIDGFNLTKDFGIVLSEIKNQDNSGKRIEVNTTKPYAQTIYRDKQTISLTCSMLGRNLQDLYNKMMQFQALCMKPGLRTFTTDTKTMNLYIKDGITVKAEHETILTFDLKMRLI